MRPARLLEAWCCSAPRSPSPSQQHFLLARWGAKDAEQGLGATGGTKMRTRGAYPFVC
jgi:hypothetical protein